MLREKYFFRKSGFQKIFLICFALCGRRNSPEGLFAAEAANSAENPASVNHKSAKDIGRSIPL